MQYLLDGYNFLFRVCSINNSLQHHREELLEHLGFKAKKLNISLTVIFDAHSQADPIKKGKIGHLSIIFTGPGQTADDWIIEELEYVTNPRLITVISSDKKLTWHARQLGAKSLSIEEFLNKLIKKKPSQTKIKSLPLNINASRPHKKTIKIDNLDDYYEEVFSQRLVKNVKDSPKELKKFESDYERWLRLFTEKDKKRIP